MPIAKDAPQHFALCICVPSLAQWADISRADPRTTSSTSVPATTPAIGAWWAGPARTWFRHQVPLNGAFYILLARCGYLDPDDYRLAFHIMDKAIVAR